MPPKVRGHVRKVKVKVQGHTLNIGQAEDSRLNFRGQYRPICDFFIKQANFTGFLKLFFFKQKMILSTYLYM